MTASGRENRRLIIGLGETGVSAARFLAARGGDVLVIDSRANPPGLKALRESNPDVDVVLESLDARWLEDVAEVVLSPGLAPDIPIAAEAARRGISVVSDIELFARFVAAPVVGVTGSNGKSTVVSLVAELLSATGIDVASGGNLGPPALDLLERDAEVYLLELSSFQLETTNNLRPVASAVLNVSSDHLDRHGSFESYAAIKERLAEASETVLFNRDDETVRKMVRDHPRAIPFSVCERLERGYCAADHNGEQWLFRGEAPLVPVGDLRIGGAHNLANALAAVGLADAMTSELPESRREAQLEALRSFAGLPHRCQWVAEAEGIVFVNDSKGTNVGATVAALRGLPGPIVLIAGGQSKGADFGPLVDVAREKLAGAVVIGEAATELSSILSGIVPVREAETMNAAVGDAIELAQLAQGRPVSVLLSPACASLDMFSDYRARGEAFVAAVRESVT